MKQKGLPFPTFIATFFCVAFFMATPLLSQTNCGVAVISGPNARCGPGTVTLTAYMKPAAPPVTYQWSNGEQSQTIIANITATTTFSVTITDVNGCTSVATKTVTVNPAPGPVSITVAQSPPYCSGQVVDLTANYNSSAGAFNILWNNGVTSQSTTGQFITTFAGTFLSANVTVYSSLCSANAGIYLEGSNLSAFIDTDSSDYVLCAGQELNLRGNISTTAPFVVNGYTWSTGATTQEIVISAPATYTVTVSTVQGCNRTAKVTIYDPLPLPTPTAVAGQEFLCVNKTAVLNVLGGPFLKYIWSNGLPPVQSPTINAPGTYTVTVKGDNGCLNSSEVTVKPGLTPPISIAGPGLICTTPPQTATLAAVGPDNLVKYKWSTQEETPSIEITAPSVYRLTVTNVQGCTNTATLSITPDDVKAATIISSKVIMCVGDSATLRVGQEFTSYAWSNGGEGRTTLVYGPGTYQVTVTNQTGCTRIATFTIQPSLVNMTINTVNPICPGDTAVLQVTGSSLVSYRWSTGQTSSSIQVTQPGQYTITVVDNLGCGASRRISVASKFIDTTRIRILPYACDGNIRLLIHPDSLSQFAWNTGDSTKQITVSQGGRYAFNLISKDGCRSRDSVMVNVPVVPNVEIAREGVLCENSLSAFTLVATTGFKRYLWSNGDTLPTLTSTQTGDYTVQVSDDLGCTATAQVSIEIATMPDPVTSVAPYACDATRTLQVNQDYASYTWSTGESGPGIQVNTPGEYRVTVTNNEGCTKVTSLQVETIPSITQVTLSGGAPFCPGGNTSLQAIGGFSEYLWSDGSTASSLNVNQPGTYAVTATDPNGCTSTSSQTIEQLPVAPVVIRGATAICTGRTSVFTLQGQWQSQVWSTGETSPSITVSQAGTYTITVTNSFGCTNFANIKLSVSDTLSPVVAELPYQCNGLITLDAGSGYANYQWSTGAVSKTIKATTSGFYTVRVSDFSGCTGSKMVFVTVPELLELSVAANQTFCAGQSIPAVAKEGFATYLWNDGVQTATRDISASGTYSLVATDAFGCTQTAEISVQELPLPTANISGPALLCSGQTDMLSLESVNASQYNWSDGSTTSSISITQGGTYSVTVFDTNGCSASAAFQVSESSVTAASVSQQNTCNGGMSLTATSGYSDYTWSFGGNTAQTEVNTSGNFELVVSNADGCTATTIFEVNIPPSPVAIIDVIGISICAGTPATLSANTGMNAYLWSDGSMGSSITAAQNGSYALTITDADGCTAQTEITVQLTDEQAPEITCPANQTRCIGDAVVTFTQPETSDNCETTTLLQTAGLPSGESYPVGITQNEWLVTDAQGNTARCNFTIEILPGATLTLLSLGNDQGGNNLGFIDIDLTGANQPYSFEWTRDNVVLATTEDLQNIGSGSYTVVVRDAQGCPVAQETYVISNTSSTSILINNNTLRILPNPVQNMLNIRFEQAPTEEYAIQLHDATGRLLIQQNRLIQQQMAVDMSQLPAGTYSLSCFSANKLATLKVIKITE